MVGMSSTRIYVGHLPYKARESDVEQFFSRYGRIREILLKNGFGFVEFDDARDAEEAVYRCNGKELRGERVIVEMTKRPPKGRDMYRSGGGRFGGGYGGGGRSNYYRSPPRRRDNESFPSQTKYRVVVENLSSRVSWQDLKDIMRAAGEVTYADAHRIRRNEGIVCFSCAADLKKAMDTLEGKEVNGRKIHLIDASRESRRRSRSKSKSRSRSHSKSRSRSSHRSRSRSKSRSGSASSKSKSRSRSRSTDKSRSKSESRSRSGSAAAAEKKRSKERPDSRKEKRSKSKEKSRSPSVEDKRDSASRSGSSDKNGRKSDVDED